MTFASLTEPLKELGRKVRLFIFGSETKRSNTTPLWLMEPRELKAHLDSMEKTEAAAERSQRRHDPHVHRGLEMKAENGRLTYVRETTSEQEWGG